MLPVSPDHPLRRLFAALVEDAFCSQVGMCDPKLTDYLADLLVNFTHVERLDVLRNVHGQPLDAIAARLAMLDDDEATDATGRERALYRHIGDYALFWAGVYPEQLKRHRLRDDDVLLDYVKQGRRSYAIASELTADGARPPARLFLHLSEDFESCLHGLGLVRRELEHTQQSGGELVY
ncbi:MAG: hypothetical protein ACE5E6_12475 [Phycisphaerae bacterium]